MSELNQVREEISKFRVALEDERKKAAKAKQLEENELFMEIVREGFLDKLLKEAVYSSTMPKEELQEIIIGVQVLETFLKSFGNGVKYLEDEIAKREQYIQQRVENPQ